MRIIIVLLLSFFSQLLTAQEEYANPVDGKTHVADWKTYHPDGGAKPQDGRVINSGVRLLSTQADFEKNTTAEDLAKLIGFIQEVLSKESQGYKGSGEILLQIELRNEDNPRFEMSYQGELTEDYLQRFYGALESIEYKTLQSTVTLQVHFVVKNA
tara:strand:- start:104 stop:571 length:468 start_codon:yes stop_codon:yes gene_type:complete